MAEIRQYLVDDMRKQLHTKLCDAMMAHVDIMKTVLRPAEGIAVLGGALTTFVPHAVASAVALTPEQHDAIYDAIAEDIRSSVAAQKGELLPVLLKLQTAIMAAVERRRAL